MRWRRGAGRSTLAGTTLFANTATAGSLASGIIAGTTAEFLGYRAALGVCAGLGLAAAWLLMISRSHEVAARR